METEMKAGNTKADLETERFHLEADKLAKELQDKKFDLGKQITCPNCSGKKFQQVLIAIYEEAELFELAGPVWTGRNIKSSECGDDKHWCLGCGEEFEVIYDSEAKRWSL